MNVKNNRRRQLSREKIESCFIRLLQTRELSRITVSDICKETGLNRSTFYANYADVYALADAIRESLEQEVAELFLPDEASKYNGGDWETLFAHIRDNRLFYETYFKLGYDSEHEADISSLAADYQIFPEAEMSYHVEFFRSGFNAIVKKWLRGGCKESPGDMNRILKNEYSGRLSLS